MTVVRAQMKDPRDVCEFFSSDVINEASAPVTQSGYKEGYLTKRGKNFGGCVQRYSLSVACGDTVLVGGKLVTLFCKVPCWSITRV